MSELQLLHISENKKSGECLLERLSFFNEKYFFLLTHFFTSFSVIQKSTVLKLI